MRMYLLLLSIFCSIHLFADGSYRVLHEGDEVMAKVKGIDDPIKLHVGAGIPKILSLDATKNKDIKLLKCFGGEMGTSVLVGYYYTYVLDFKKKKVIGFIEYYDDYGHYTKADKTPKWAFKKDKIEVVVYDDEKEDFKKIFIDL